MHTQKWGGGGGARKGAMNDPQRRNGCHGMLNQCLKDLHAIRDHNGKAFQCISPLVSTQVTCNLLDQYTSYIRQLVQGH